MPEWDDSRPPWERLPGWDALSGIGHAVVGDRVPAWRDPDEERKRQQALDAARPDLGARLGRFSQEVQHDPALATLGLVGEAFHNAAAYPLGVLQGGVQAGLEARTGANLAGQQDYGAFGSAYNPPTRNIADPAEALARYHALTPGPVQFAEDVLMGGAAKLPGVAAGGVKGAISAVGEHALPQGGTLAPLAANRAAGVAAQVGEAALNLAGSRGAQIAVPLEAGREAFAGSEGQPLPERALETGLAAVGGLALASAVRTIRPAASRALAAATGPGRAADAIFPGVDAARSPEAAQWVDRYSDTLRSSRGDVSGRAYPGQDLQLFWDTNVRGALSDRIPHLETISKVAEQQFARKLTDPEASYLNGRLVPGMKPAAQQFAVERLQKAIHEAGVREDGAGPSLDQLWAYAQASMEEAELSRVTATLGPTGAATVTRDPLVVNPLFRGPQGPKYAEAAAAKAEMERALAAQWPHIPPLAGSGMTSPGVIQRFQSFVSTLTGTLNDSLDHLVASDVLPQAVADESKARHSVYTVLTNVEELYNEIGKKNLPKELSVTSSGIGYLTEREAAPIAKPEDVVGRIQNIYKIAQQNAAMQGLHATIDGLKQLNPDWEKVLAPNAVQRRGGTLHPNTQVPEGYARIAYFDKGGEYRESIALKEIADTLNGMGAQELGTTGRILARFVTPFRLGITSLNLGFVYGHANREFQTALEKAPAGAAWEVARNATTAIADYALHGLDQWVERNAHHPIAQGVGERIGQATARALQDAGVQAAARARTGYIREMIARGGGGSSLQEAAYSPTGAARLFGVPGTRPELLGMTIPDVVTKIPVAGGAMRGVVGTLSSVEQAMAAMTYTLDQAPRAAMFKVAPKYGITGARQVLAAREMGGIDFQKGGSWVRAMNSFVPLLNARTQGWLNSAQGAWENPERVAFRAVTMVGLPTISAYTHNRLNYGDLYDKIPAEEKDRYFNIIIGRHTDEQGRETPVRFRIVKSPFVQLIASPLEHLLDAHYHVSAGQTELADEQRTPRSAQEMWLSRLAMALPWEPRPDEMTSPINHGMAALTMMPYIGVPAEMWANKDYFTGRPIVPDEQRILPPKYQFGRRTSETAKALGAFVQPLLPEGSGMASPERIDYLVQGWGGTAAQGWMHMGDKVLSGLQSAGLMGPDPFSPKTAADLGLGPDASPARVAKYLEAQPRPDPRPWWMEFLPRIFSQAGGGDTIAAHVAALGPHERQVYEQTKRFNEAASLKRQDLMEELHGLYENAGKLTHTQFREKEHEIYVRVADAYAKNPDYPLALRDWKETEAFRKQLPGFNARPFADALPNLPAGVSPDQVLGRWLQAGAAVSDPYQKAQAQDKMLLQMAQEYKLPPGVLKDHIGARQMEKELPAVPVAAAYLDRAIAEYRAPPDPRTGERLDPLRTPIAQWRQAQQGAVQRLAQEWGIPPQDVADRLANRHLTPFEVNPAVLSRSHAASMASDLHEKVPTFADARGQPLGDPANWPRLEADLVAQKQALEQRKVPRAAWPAQVRALDDAHHYGEVAKVQLLLRDPRAADYERWYGSGRDIPVQEWEDYQSGKLPKYRTGTPAQWLKWDMMQRLYRALPADSPTKRSLQPVAQELARQTTPGWAARVKLLADEE